MFRNSSRLATIYASNRWDVSAVTSSSNMFASCSSLVGEQGTIYDSTVVDKTRAIIDGGQSNPGYLTGLEVYAVFDSADGSLTFFKDDMGKYTNNQVVGTKTYWMGIESLNPIGTSQIPWYSKRTSIQLVTFEDTISPISTAYWFYGCNNALLTTIDFTNLDTSNVTNMASMFRSCSKLTSLDISDFDTLSVTDMNMMFYNCSGLTSLDVSDIDTSNVTNMAQMFQNCSGLTSLDVSNFNTSNVTNMSNMFYNCSGLTSLDLSDLDTSNVMEMPSMFYNCNKLTSLDVSDFNTSNVTTMYSMFRDCSALTSLDLSGFNTLNVTSMQYMFYGCSSLTSLDVSGFNTSNVWYMNDMFEGCSDLTILDLSNFNALNVVNMSQMFRNCSALETIYASNDWDVSGVSSSINMFTNCTNLVGGQGTMFDSTIVDKTLAIIDEGHSNPGYLTLGGST